jgi:hypothetical protein
MILFQDDDLVIHENYEPNEITREEARTLYREFKNQ